MPMELRKLVFSREELISAAYGYCLHVGKPMPEAVVTEVLIRADPELVLTLRFDVNDPQARRAVDLNRGEIAAALIRYCRRISVPLPRNAKKIVQPAEDGLMMLINLNYEIPKASAA